MLCTLNVAGLGFRLESPVPLDLHPHYTPYLYESKEPDVRIRILTDAPDYPAGAPAFSSGRLAVYPTEYGWFRELYAQTTMNTWDSAQSALLCDELTALTGSFPVFRLDCRLGPEGAALCAGRRAGPCGFFSVDSTGAQKRGPPFAGPRPCRS